MPCRINIVGLRNSKSASENGKSMSHDLAQLRTIFTSALASDCLDAMGYGKQVLGEDIHMLSGEGVMLGWQHMVQRLLLLDASLVDWSGRHVAAWLCLLLVISYALIRGWLHRRYA